MNIEQAHAYISNALGNDNVMNVFNAQPGYFQIRPINWHPKIHYEIMCRQNGGNPILKLELHIEPPVNHNGIFNESLALMSGIRDDPDPININGENVILIYRDAWIRRGASLSPNIHFNGLEVQNIEAEGEILLAAFNAFRDRTYDAFQNIMPRVIAGNHFIQNPMNQEPGEVSKVSYISCQNKILYGPPGTGKTFDLTKLALGIVATEDEQEDHEPTALFNKKVITGVIEFTTFHQNYAYEDFIEGIKAELHENQDGSKSVNYKIESGILKRLAHRALYAWLTGKLPHSLMTVEEIQVVMNYLNDPDQNQQPANVAQTQQFVLIIDEINRGNVARIFGELITLVEDSKRATAEFADGQQPIYATLPYSKEKFILPPNLHIIGTMNTADRSLIGLDAALRRRFEFIECPPKPESLGTIDDIDMRSFLGKLNEQIEALDSRDHCIGHAYFLSAQSFNDIRNIMRCKVIPQLQEYFHDRPDELYKLLTVRIGEKEESFVDRKNGKISENNIANRAMYSSKFILN